MCASAPNAKQESIPSLEELTLDEKIGQLFVGAGHGNFTSEDDWRYQALLHEVRDNKVGGIIWFVSDVYETAFLTEKLQAAAKVPLLVSADLEAGMGMRFQNTTFWPWAMAVAATGEPRFAEELGRITAREAKTLGINHLLAPVADVNVDPLNPVINTRSFGEDPQEVARYVTSFVIGAQAEGVLATAKHFPGHGDTHVDSHRSLPKLEVSRERLQQVELVPFRAALEAGVASVMIGHLSVPSLDGTPAPVRRHDEAAAENPYATEAHEIEQEGTVPSTLSAKVIEGLLREQLGFKGLVVSDAFDMGALVAHYDAGEAAVLGILAGEDQIMKSPDNDAAVAAVKAAVARGRISEARIDQSVRRILAAKARVGVPHATQDQIFRTIDSKAHREVSMEIAHRSMTLLREESGALPLRRDARVVVLMVSDETLNPLTDIGPAIGRRLAHPPQLFHLDSRSRIEDAREFIEAAKKADTVLLALAIRARSGAGHMAIPDAAREAVAQIPAEIETVGVSFGSPYILSDLPGLRTYLCAWGIQPVLQGAAVNALFGEAPVTGRLPVTIPELHKRGEGIQKR